MSHGDWVASAILAGVTALMAAATAFYAYQSWMARREQRLPLISIWSLRENKNPPDIAADYWLASTDSESGGKFYQHACGRMPGEVHYLFIKNVGSGIASNVEIRIESTGILNDIETNTTEMPEMSPQDTYLIPIGLTEEADPRSVARCIVKYQEFFRDKYIGHAVDYNKEDLGLCTRGWLTLRHPALKYKRKSSKEMAYYRTLWNSDDRFNRETPIKDNFGIPPVSEKGSSVNATASGRLSRYLARLLGQQEA